MLRGRGRKRGPYNSYEFKGVVPNVPKTTAFRISNPPPPKIQRVHSTLPVSSGVAHDNIDVAVSNLVAETPLPAPLNQHPKYVNNLPVETPLPAPLNDHPQGGPIEQPVCAVHHHSQDPPDWQLVDEDAIEPFDDSHEDDDKDEEENFEFYEEQDPQQVPSTENDQPPPEDPGSSDDDDESDLALAPDLNLTVSERIKMLLLLAAKKRHNLTYAATECILRLAGVWSNDFSFAPSKHILKAAITMYSSSLSVHHICPQCNIYVGEVFDESLECGNCSFEINAKLNKKQGNVFLYVSIADQIKSLLVHSGLFNELINSRQSPRIQRGNYEDIFDGRLYKTLVGPNCISFNFFVDGVQVRSTSKSSAVPVLLAINELPIHLRRKHVLMASVWLGKKKPIMNEYLKPFVKECILLERDGINFKVNGVEVHLKVIPLLGVSDSVARPTLRNSTQFNGRYGCGLCYHPGFSMRRGRGRCRSYSIAEREFPRRTHEETRENARVAEALGSRRRGIIGPSILTEIPGFDIINCLDLDLFHALVNCAKRFTNLWLSSRYAGRPFNVSARFEEVDRRLLSITPTNSVSRNPRSLSERSDFRGHEWFSWVVFYSVPVLTKILPNKYLSHWALLVHGIVLLMQNSVSKADVVYAGRYLRQFNSEIDRLYGAEHVTFSTHLLTHLEESTMNFAQPWTHSAFMYENFLAELIAAIHSSNGIAYQIVKHMQLRLALITMKNDLNYAMNDIERDFLKSVTHSSKVLAEPSVVINGVSLLGEGKRTLLPPNLHGVLAREGFQPVEGNEYTVFERCIFNNEIFQSVNYQRVEKQNNSTVLLKSGEVFEVHYFIVVDNVALALGHYLVRNQTRVCNVVLPHLKIFNEKCEGNLRCVRVLHFDMKLLSFCICIAPEQSLRFGCINVLEKEMLH